MFAFQIEKESFINANEVVSPGRNQKLAKNNWKTFPIEVEYNHRGEAPIRRNNTSSGINKSKRFSNGKNLSRDKHESSETQLKNVKNSHEKINNNEKENKSENNTDEELNVRDYW